MINQWVVNGFSIYVGIVACLLVALGTSAIASGAYRRTKPPREPTYDAEDVFGGLGLVIYGLIGLGLLIAAQVQP